MFLPILLLYTAAYFFSSLIRQSIDHAYHKAVHFLFGDSFLLRHDNRMSQQSNVLQSVSTIPFLSSNGSIMFKITSLQPFGTTERIYKKVSLVILLYIDKIYLSTVFLRFCKFFTLKLPPKDNNRQQFHFYGFFIALKLRPWPILHQRRLWLLPPWLWAYEYLKYNAFFPLYVGSYLFYRQLPRRHNHCDQLK